MYLSRVALDTNRRQTMAAMASPHQMHGLVESCFGNYGVARKRNLWRIDWLNGTCYLMMLSAEPPECHQLSEQLCNPELEQPWETKAYTPLLERLQEGDQWQFRLSANPVKSSAKDKENQDDRGRVHAHVTQEQQNQWLQQRSEKNGFILEENQFNVVRSEWKRFTKGSHARQQVTLRMATYEGVLKIHEVQRFKEALMQGIGRGKAYGCGLLTIAR